MVISVMIKNQTKKINVNSAISGSELLTQHYPQEQTGIIACLHNGKLKDLSWPITEDGTLVQFVQQTDAAANSVLNYSCGLVIAHAIQLLYPKAKIAIVQTTADGFYVDFDERHQLKGEELKKVATEAKKLIAHPIKFQRLMQTTEEAIATFNNNIYAQEYIKLNHVKGFKCSYLINNQQRITAAGVAYADASIATHFALLAVTGAYWLGNEQNVQLQRITGVAAWTKIALEQILLALETRKLRDHRVVGKKLQIFTFNEEIGKGLPILLPNGMVIKKVLQQFLRKKEFKWGYQEVSTPVLGSVGLYQKSGHWVHYRESMFDIIEHEQEKLVLRPMTCPHHCMLYQAQKHSYRDLPLRLSENALLFRYETSGALTGLERVRSMELTDAHLFVRPDQIKSEFKRCFYLIDEVLKTLKIEIDYFSLSLRDPADKAKYYNDDAMWNQAESELKAVLDELQINYQMMIGEAAFYGPKFDIQIKTPIGHEVTLSTIQFDFLLPKMFDLTYVDNNNQAKRPIIIHRGLIGTYERFIATFLEQTQGIFPLWLSPIQIAILPINNQMVAITEYCDKLLQTLVNENIRGQIYSLESLQKRIKIVHEQKIPYIIIIGENEVKSNKVTYHTYQNQKNNLSISQSALINLLITAIKNYQ